MKDKKLCLLSHHSHAKFETNWLSSLSAMSFIINPGFLHHNQSMPTYQIVEGQHTGYHFLCLIMLIKNIYKLLGLPTKMVELWKQMS